jgi:hypothetical protein
MNIMSRIYMTVSLRLVLTAGLVGVFLFCGFGFLDTYEPGDQSVAMIFRLCYGITGAATLIGLIALWRKKAKTDG